MTKFLCRSGDHSYLRVKLGRNLLKIISLINMSSLRNIGHEKALELLTCRPVDIDCHCLDQGKSSPISMKTLPSRQSSRGRLDFLVPEISDQVLKLLDFESLANFRSTSYSCKVAVEGIREYVDVMVHAPGALRILRSTGTISLHSVWFIYQQLISSRCVVCNDYGKSVLNCFWLLHTSLFEPFVDIAVNWRRARDCDIVTEISVQTGILFTDFWKYRAIPLSSYGR